MQDKTTHRTTNSVLNYIVVGGVLFIAFACLFPYIGNLKRYSPGEDVKVRAQVQDVLQLPEGFTYDVPSAGLTQARQQTFPCAIATGGGRFTVQESDSSAFQVGSVWLVKGLDSKPEEISTGDRNHRSKVTLQVSTPLVPITNKVHIKGFVEVRGEAFGQIMQESGTILHLRPKEWFSVVLKCNDVEFSLRPSSTAAKATHGANALQSRATPAPVNPFVNTYEAPGISLQYPMQWQSAQTSDLAKMRRRLTSEYNIAVVSLAMFSSSDNEVQFCASQAHTDQPLSLDDILAQRRAAYDEALRVGKVTKLNQLDKTAISNFPAVVEDFDGNNNERVHSVKIPIGNLIVEVDLIANDKRNYMKHSQEFREILASLKINDEAKK